MQAFGRVDILIANAGVQHDAPLAAMTPAAWSRVIDVSLTGAIRTPINRAASTPEAERQLLERIAYGRVGEPEDIAQQAALWLTSHFATTSPEPRCS